MSRADRGVFAPSRRGLLATAAASLLAAPWRRARADAPAPVTIHVPYGPQSTIATAVNLLQAPAAALFGAAITSVYPEPPHPMRQALEAVVTPGSDDIPLLAADVLAYVMWEEARVAQGLRQTLESLTPICKLTNGYSTTLFVATSSPIADWVDFAHSALSVPMTIADANGRSIHLRFLEIALSVYLGYRQVQTRADVFQAVISGTVAAGLIDTIGLLAFSRENPGWLRPILTFGGQRSLLLQVPTLREVSGNHNLATTNSVALFGSARLEPTQLERLHLAFAEAATDPAVIAAAAALEFPLAVEDPDVVQETIARDRRVVRTGFY